MVPAGNKAKHLFVNQPYHKNNSSSGYLKSVSALQTHEITDHK